jgi:isoleucyl-tRNA synthetase
MMLQKKCLHKYDSSDIKHLTKPKLKFDRNIIQTENKNGDSTSHGIKNHRKQAFLNGLVKFENQELGSKYIDLIQRKFKIEENELISHFDPN